MKNRGFQWAAIIIALALSAPWLAGTAKAQSTDDDSLLYCYGNQCRSSLGGAIGLIEAAYPDYEKLFEEVDKQIAFENGRPRPLSFTFRVNPRPPSQILQPVYSMAAVTNPAPEYCGESGDPMYPRACASEGELIQGFVGWYAQLYGANRVQHSIDRKSGYFEPYAEVSSGGTAENPMGMYAHNNWRTGQIPEVTVTVFNENGTIAYGHGGTARLLKFTTFKCRKGFTAKGGANPAYHPGTWNPTEPGTECRPSVGDQVIYTRLRQTTCPEGKDTNSQEGNPCSPATGDKAQYETDFEFAGRPFGRAYHSLGQVEQRKALAPGWVHTYSDRIYGSPGSLTSPLMLADSRGQIDVFVRQGNSSRFVSESAANRVLDVETGNTYKVTSQDGTVRRFNAAGRLVSIENADTAWRIEFAYAGELLATATDQTGRVLTFQYLDGRLSTLRLPDASVVGYSYDATGNLQAVQYPDGRTRTYHYNEAGLSDANDAHALTGISDNGERYATYAYDAKNRARLTQHHANGQVVDRIELAYGTNGVVNVTGRRGEARAYTISNAAGYRRVASVTHANGTVMNTYSGAMPLQHKDRLGNVTRYEYANGYESARYEAVGTPDERKVTTERNAAYRVTSRTVSAKVGAAYVPKQQTTYAYNSRGQLTSTTVTDPSASPVLSRTTTTTYCEQADVDAGICPRVGLVMSVDGPRPGAVDATTYQYRMADDPACGGQTGACAWRKGDLWKVANSLGQTMETLRRDGNARPLSVRDANGIVTDFEYDPAGRLTARKTRGTNDGSEADDRITRMSYWPTGEIRRITQPDGTWTKYSYDSAHRLTGIADHIGNTITYSLDAAGERTSEQTRDHVGSLRRSLSRAYNTLGQLQSQTDAYQRATTFTYDNNGNLDRTTDALLRETDNDYDALGRLKRILQNATGGQVNAVETKFEYDALDNVTKVIDPNQLSTTYVYNGLGELKSLQSPDTGSTSYSYDVAGNRQSQTDARGVQTLYGYDTLNRITSVTYPSDSSLNTTYVYDVAQPDCAAGETFLIGRLAKMTDHSGGTVYCHDRFGQLVRKVQRTMGKTFVQRWQYAANGRLQSMTYPDGSIVDYQYDPQGRMVEMGVTIAGRAREKVAYDVLYHPWGGPARWRSMMDRMEVRTLNLNGQPGIVQAQNIAELPIDGISLGYEFDEVGNLKRLRDGNQADPPERIYGYDALNRLTEAKDAANVVWQSYSYDKTGNRQTAGWREVVAQQDCAGVGPGEPCAPLPPTTQWKTESYGYQAGTHRLSGRGSRLRYYDNAGNLTLDTPNGGVQIIDPPPGGETESAAYAGTMQTQDEQGGETAPPGAVARGYSYNAANRMSGASLAGELVMSYRHNGRGERVYRQGIDKTVHTVFDESGRWIGDYDASGTVIQQAIWLGDLPVGLLARDGGTTRLFHVEPDMLGSPRAVIDPTRGMNGTVVWRWDLAGEAFGNDKPNEDPDGDGTAFVLDMRFPGQQYDSATGLNYNYFRDYEASTGRYVESDPIGLDAGINTYTYVGATPLVRIDPHGLQDSGLGDSYYYWEMGMQTSRGRVTYRPCGGAEMAVCRQRCGNRGVMRCAIGRYMKLTQIRRTKTDVPIFKWVAVDRIECECGDDPNACSKSATCTLSAIAIGLILISPWPDDILIPCILGTGAATAAGG
ncbi:MAG: RHS repeat protein [Lysobacter sp.]|nr:RHS repeat protein [Lysobacter sp.]